MVNSFFNKRRRRGSGSNSSRNRSGKSKPLAGSDRLTLQEEQHGDHQHHQNYNHSDFFTSDHHHHHNSRRGVLNEDESEQLKQQYWKMATKYHPDLNPENENDQTNTIMFTKLSEAYARLRSLNLADGSTDINDGHQNQKSNSGGGGGGDIPEKIHSDEILYPVCGGVVGNTTSNDNISSSSSRSIGQTMSIDDAKSFYNSLFGFDGNSSSIGAAGAASNLSSQQGKPTNGIKNTTTTTNNNNTNTKNNNTKKMINMKKQKQKQQQKQKPKLLSRQQQIPEQYPQRVQQQQQQQKQLLHLSQLSSVEDDEVDDDHFYLSSIDNDSTTQATSSLVSNSPPRGENTTVTTLGRRLVDDDDNDTPIIDIEMGDVDGGEAIRSRGGTSSKKKTTNRSSSRRLSINNNFMLADKFKSSLEGKEGGKNNAINKFLTFRLPCCCGGRSISFFRTWCIKSHLNLTLTIIEIILTWIVILTVICPPIASEYFDIHLDDYKIPMTNALIVDVVGGVAIMGAQLVLHYWYGFLHYPSLMHLFVTSESLNERFNDIRDVCSLYYNGDTEHRDQYNAIVVTFPFTMYNHAVTYIISTFCCIIRVIQQWNRSCLTTLKRRRRNADNNGGRGTSSLQSLAVTESLSSHEALSIDEHTVIIRALGITVVIAGLSFMRILGGMEFTIFSTVVFLMNQHLYNSLLFRKSFCDFLLSIAFGNLFVIARLDDELSKMKGQANDKGADRRTDTDGPVDEEMGLEEGVEHTLGNWDDHRSLLSDCSSEGSEIVDTWAFASKESLSLCTSIDGVTGTPLRSAASKESNGSSKPYDFHVCFGSEEHPGTKAFRGAVRSVADKYSGKAYSMRARRDIKMKLKGRRYYVKKNSGPSETWRRASFLQVRKRCREYYEEEATKLVREITLKDEILEKASYISAEDVPKERNQSMDSLERDIIGTHSQDHSLMALLETFSASYDEALKNLDELKNERNKREADTSVTKSREAQSEADSSAVNNPQTESVSGSSAVKNQQTESVAGSSSIKNQQSVSGSSSIKSQKTGSVAGSSSIKNQQTESVAGSTAQMSLRALASDKGDESIGESTNNSSVLNSIKVLSMTGTTSTDTDIPHSMPSILSLEDDDETGADDIMTRSTMGSSLDLTHQTNETELVYDERSKEEMETTQDLWYGLDRGSYVIENVESQDAGVANFASRELDMLVPSSDSIWSELGDSFEAANRYLQELAGSSTNSNASTTKTNTAESHGTDQEFSSLRIVTSEDVEQRRKMRLELQRDEIQAMRERKRLKREADRRKPVENEKKSKTGLFWPFRLNVKRKKGLEIIEEVNELEEASGIDARSSRSTKDSKPIERFEAKVSPKKPKSGLKSNLSGSSSAHEETGTLETEAVLTETTHNKTEDSKITPATHETIEESFTGNTENSDWRETLHLKLSELTGQDTTHFPSVYRQKKRDLEAKYYTSSRKDSPSTPRKQKVIDPPRGGKHKSSRSTRERHQQSLYQLTPDKNPTIPTNNEAEAPPPPAILANKSAISSADRSSSLLSQIEFKDGDDDCSEVTFDLKGPPSSMSDYSNVSKGWDYFFF